MPQQKSAGLSPRFSSNSLRGELLADRCGLGALRLLDDAGRLAAQIAQVIQLGAAYLAAAHHLDRVDHRRHHGEYALHAFAVGNLAHRKTLVEPAAGAADADALIGLYARAIAFDHLDVDDHGVAGSEFRNLLAGGQFFELLFFELLNEVHRKISIGGAPGAGCASVRLSCHCPDLALVYGKDRALSPVCRAFRAFLALGPGYQEIGPPRPGQRLGLRPPPGPDLALLPRSHDLPNLLPPQPLPS